MGFLLNTDHMPRILVIDDTPAMRAVLEDMLVRAGHQVTLTSNGKEALAFLQNTTVDIVITDIVMPEVDGLEVLTKLRRMNPRPGLIAMSGGGRGSVKDYLELAALFGAVATLEKPFTRDDLFKAIEVALEPKRKA
jgi:CheY-like chemotaxis protein